MGFIDKIFNKKKEKKLDKDDTVSVAEKKKKD